MYVRDNKRGTGDDFFQMEEYCSVLLMARYIREAGEDFEKDLQDTFIPIVGRGQLDRMPEEVAEEFDRILQLVVATLEQAGTETEEFFAKLETGEYDPVGDVVNSKEMVNAMGNVIIKRLGIREGLRGDAAFARAKELLPRVKDEMMNFIGQMMMGAFHDIGRAAHEQNIPLDRATKILKPRVHRIAAQGIAVETAVDMGALKKLERGEKKPDKDTSTKFDPSYC